MFLTRSVISLSSTSIIQSYLDSDIACYFSFHYILHTMIPWSWQGLSFLFPLSLYTLIPWIWQSLLFIFPLHPAHNHTLILTRSDISLSSASYTQSLDSDKVCYFFFQYILHTIMTWWWQGLSFLFPLHPVHSHSLILRRSVISLSFTSNTLIPWFWQTLSFLFPLHPTHKSWQGPSFLFPLHPIHNHTLMLTKSVISLSSTPYTQSHLDHDRVCHFSFLYILIHTHPLSLTPSVISISSTSYTQSHLDPDTVCHFFIA